MIEEYTKQLSSIELDVQELKQKITHLRNDRDLLNKKIIEHEEILYRLLARYDRLKEISRS